MISLVSREHITEQYVKAKLIYHFDVEDHSLSLDQFVETALATRLIVKCFNENFFDGRLKLQLRVKPSESGGYVEIIETIFYGAGALAFITKTLDSSLGRVLLRSLTGKTDEEWYQSFTNFIKSQLEKSKKSEIDRAIEPDILLPNPTEYDHLDIIKYLDEGEREAFIFCFFVISFIQADKDQIEAAGLSKKI